MKDTVKRLLAVLLSASLSGLLPLASNAEDAGFTTLKFDFGAKGTASGYIGVKAEDKYSASAGYGFLNPDAVENVSASGKDALSDAVRFKQNVPGHVFNVDVPSGVYKIKVTTGDVKSAIVNAEGIAQLYFLTGSNASDSFTIPVTDGQLNIYTSSGVGDVYSFSALEIEQVSSDTKTKPTIWLYGDSTVCNYYNVPDSNKHGWGQDLYKYVDMKKYDVRNLAISGMTAKTLAGHESLDLIGKYGKSGDIFVLSIGINDYTNKEISESQYREAVTKIAKLAVNKGMKVYLVKQHGENSDWAKYPLPTTRWYGEALDEIGAALKVNVIDLFRPWLELILDNAYYDQKTYYADGLHLNALGADRMAQMVSLELFPVSKPVVTVAEDVDDDSQRIVVYEAEASGKAVSNPHKGYVMTAYEPHYIDSTKGYEYGIGGPKDNRAWDCCTIVSGEPKWCLLNPEKGKYDWSSIDRMLDKCEEYGLTYGIRILPYSSYNGKDYVPQWVYDEGAEKQTVKRKDKDEYIEFPVWDHPVYLQACRDFATALAEHYDGDPRVEFIDVSVFGDFGEWHNSFAEGDYMPSLEEQKKMLDHYASVFKKTLLALPSSARGEIYRYALSIGITKRDNSLICTPNSEWSLLPAYRANMPVIGENLWPYSMMKNYREVRRDEYDYLNWTPERFRETIEISHLSIFAFDQDSHSSYEFYKENKAVIDEMCNRLGYNYTVTSAKLNGNKLKVKIKNTGLAPSFFNIDLCAEITDEKGNKKGLFGEPVKIKKGSFKDGSEKSFEFELKGELKEGDVICLAMYDCDNSLVKGKDPTVRFDNKNNLPNKRLKLVVKEIIEAKKENTPTPTITPRPTVTSAPAATMTPAPAVVPEVSVVPTVTPEATTVPSVSPAAVETDGYKVKVSGKEGAEVVAVPEKSVINVPSAVTVDGRSYKVTSIADRAFANNKKITKIVIGDNITKIGDKAFKNCTNLKYVLIGSGVRSIGREAFRGCKKLKRVTVKTKLLKKKKVGKNAFKGIAKKAVFKIPKKKAKSYKTIFRNVSKGTKIKFQLKK